MIRCREPLYRPPAEAGSLILQAAYGCAHNRCTFCGMYKGVRYQVRPEAELFGEISEAARLYPETRRVFLADGNALGLGYDRLRPLLERLVEAFPRLARVNLYANCRSIAALTDGELTGLRRLKLNTLYTGLESGSQRVLDLVHKGESAAETVRQVRRAEAAGFTCSVMVLVGLGRQSYSEEHADATAAALNLEAILKQVAPGVEIIGTLESVEESVEWLRANPQPDLLFMDIHLADGDSFRIFDAVEIAAPVIFTTAYDQYALEAFKVNSIDYLLKPLNASDVGRALAKLHRLTSVERSDYGSRVRTLAASRREEVFLVHVRDKIIPLHRSRIAYCYTSNEKVTAYGFDGAAYPLDKTLEALQGLLPESEFFRANRQFIVARQAVKEIAVWFGSRLTLHLTVETPERIVISKARVPEFKAWLRSLHPVE